MGQYLGSWKIDDYLPIPAVCHRFSSGAAYAPTSITYSIYEDAGTTGIDENIDMVPASPFDSITGLYYARRQLTTAAGFEKGKNYIVVIKATVDSVSAIDVHTFQIEAEVDANTVSPTTVAANVTQWNGSAVATPTTAGVPEVDVTHWSGTEIPGTDTAGYPKVTIKSGSGNGELTITSGRTNADVTHWKTAVAGDIATPSDVWAATSRTLTAPTNITSTGNAIPCSATDDRVYVTLDAHTSGCTVADVTATVDANVAQVSGDSTAADNAEAFFDGTGYAGTNNVIPTVTSVTSIAAGGITATSIATDAITAAKIAGGAIDAGALSTDGVEKIADAFLDRDMNTGTDSGSTTVRTPRQALRMLRNKWGISAGTLTVYKEDDATESWTGAVTTTAGNPVTAVNPAGGS